MLEKSVSETGKGIVLPYIKKILDSWIEPKLDKFIKESKITRELLKEDISQKFIEYLNIAYEDNFYLQSVVLKNQQKKLEDLYVPLTVISTKDQENITINSYSEEFIPKYKKVLVVDTAGMGKSTLLKKLFLSCIESNKGIPIFLELRNLEVGEDILSQIINMLSPIDEKIDNDVIRFLLKRGDFIFFLDGYDEIPLDKRSEIIKNILKFLKDVNKNLFIISSRDEGTLASLGQFQRFTIKPLQIEEAFALINNYGEHKETAKNLIEKIKDDKNFKNIEEFLKNPLLVSLLYKSFEYKPKIQYKKYLYYEQVFDALYEAHDLSKPQIIERAKYSNLGIDEFRKVLRYLGPISYRLGRIIYSKEKILELIKKVKEFLPNIEFQESNFLKDLIETVPLFTKEGLDYKWSHKSIQEYFVACWLCYEVGNKKHKLRDIYNNSDKLDIINVLDILQEMDSMTFDAVITKEILANFVKFNFNSEISTLTSIPTELLEIRIYNLFIKNFGVFTTLHPMTTKDQRPLFKIGKSLIDVFKILNSTTESGDINQIGTLRTYSFIGMKRMNEVGFYSIETTNVHTKYIEMLETKKYDLFKKIFVSTEFNEYKVPMNSFIIISANSDSKQIYNKKKYFTYFNYLMCENTINNILDLDKCIKYLQKIENYPSSDSLEII